MCSTAKLTAGHNDMDIFWDHTGVAAGAKREASFIHVQNVECTIVNFDILKF
jgi:hypothetical protein